MKDIEDIIDINLDNFVIELCRYNFNDKKEYNNAITKLRKIYKKW